MSRLAAGLRRTWPSLILGLLLIVLVLNCLEGALNPRNLLALRRHRYSLDAQRTQLITENAELGTIVQKLRSDDRYLERLIRRELGYARPDELVYKFAPEMAGTTR
jgi:cell division protein FtsB